MIHELIYCLCSQIVFLINYHLFSSLSFHGSWPQWHPKGARLPLRLPAVMDGLTSSQVLPRNAPVIRMMLGRHIRPDGWGSLSLQGWGLQQLLVEAAGNFWLLFCALFGLVSLLCVRCSWICFILKSCIPLLLRACKALQDSFGDEDLSSSPPF